jgi:hypothetical protein
VKRGEDEVSGLGGGEGDLNRFAIAHLSDKNHFGRLTQGCSECQCKTWGIGVQFALVNRGLHVRMQELDRVLNGNDVIGLLVIDLADDCSQSR